MIKRLFKSLPTQATATSLQNWRERILTIFLWVLVVFGTLAYAINISSALRNGLYGVVVFYSVAFIWVLAITIFKKIPYTIRAGSMLALAFAVGMVAFSDGGLVGDGRVWFMFLAIFAGILFGLQTGIAAVIISTIAFGYYGWVWSGSGSAPQGLSENETAIWISTGVVLVWLTLTVVSSVAVLLQGLSSSQVQLEEALESQKRLNEELLQEHQLLTARTRDLEKSVTQVRTAAEISRLISAELDPDQLIQNVVELIKARFDLYYVGLFLVDESQLYAELRAGTGEAGRKMLSEGHKLSVGGTSMVGWATANRKARIALDTGEEEIRFKNPHLPLTRSEMALPLMRGMQIMGALSIQSTKADAFSENDIVVLQGIADSLATAIENAELFSQIETSLGEIQKLNRLYLGEGWEGLTESDRAMVFIAEGEQGSPGDGESRHFEIPLKLRDQQMIGNILLEAERKDWTADEMEFIEAVSNQAALALESARLLEESQKRVQRERTLNEITAKFSRSLEVDSLMRMVVQELGNLPNVREVSLHMRPPGDDEEYSSPPAELVATANLDEDDGMAEA